MEPNQEKERKRERKQNVNQGGGYVNLRTILEIMKRRGPTNRTVSFYWPRAGHVV